MYSSPDSGMVETWRTNIVLICTYLEDGGVDLGSRPIVGVEHDKHVPGKVGGIETHQIEEKLAAFHRAWKEGKGLCDWRMAGEGGSVVQIAVSIIQQR